MNSELFVLLSSLAAIAYGVDRWWHHKEIRRTGQLQRLNDAVLQLYGHTPNINRLIAKSETLKATAFDDWDEEDKEIAHDVCGMFHHFGALVYEKALPADVFGKLWYFSVPASFEIVRPYLDSVRKERGPNYWGRFDYLVWRVKVENRGGQGYPISAWHDGPYSASEPLNLLDQDRPERHLAKVWRRLLEQLI